MQNTYTNADKLLEAAEQLAQTGECDPEEIYQAAHQLEDRIQDFVRRVEQRKILLDMSVSFHSHVKEVRCQDAQRSLGLKGSENPLGRVWTACGVRKQTRPVCTEQLGVDRAVLGFLLVFLVSSITSIGVPLPGVVEASVSAGVDPRGLGWLRRGVGL